MHQAIEDTSTLFEMQQRALEAEEEVEALRKQLIALRHICEQQKQEKNILQSQLAEQPSLPSDDSALKQRLAESEQHSKQLERVIQFLREKAEGAHLEAKQLREEIIATKSSIGTLTQQLQAAHEQIDELTAQLAQKEKIAIQTKSDAQSVKMEDRENHLRTAQQHVAKKMKEIASLSERNEEQKRQIFDLQRAITDAQTKYTSLQHSFDVHLQNEKRLQDQLQEMIRNHDAHSKRWEEKYFTVHEKWQETERQNHFLRRLEEKQKQLQGLLTSMQALIDPPSQKSETPKEIPPIAIRYKQTVFDK